LNNILIKIFSILNEQEKKKFYGLTALNVVISLLDIFSLALLLFIINFYTQNSNYAIPFLPQWLLNKHSVALILCFLLFFLLKNIAAHFVYSRQYNYVYNVASRISGANLLNYLEGNYADHVHIDSAVHIRSISQQPVEFAHYILSGVQQIITEIALILFATVTLLAYNAKLFLSVITLLLPVTILTWFYTRRKIQAKRSNVKQQNANTLQYLKEALAGFVESNIYDKNMFFTKRYAKSQQGLNTDLAGLQIIQGLPPRLLEVFAVFGLFVLIIANKISGTEHLADFIAVGAFMAAAYKVIPGLVRIINLSGQIKAYKFTIHDLLKEKRGSVRAVKEENIPFIHSISFDNIFFSHQDHKIFSNFNLRVNSGEFVGISGPSGRGKTTIIHLLLGLVKEDKGSIYINAEENDIFSRKKYWKKIAYVKQQNFLIHDTIEKNITLDEGPYDPGKLKEVVELAGLDNFVAMFPEKLKKVITENGKNISGGQRQRIAIARALFKDADVIILDEPFSELDNASELLLLQHFKALSESGKMIILITHQQKSLSFCDKIIYLDD